MLFSRTKQSLQNLQRQRSLTLGEMYAVMQDVMQDIQDETGTSPAELQPDDSALLKWRTIAHVLLRSRIDDSAEKLNEKQQQRLQALQSDLDARYADSAGAEEQLKQDAEKIDALNREIDRLQTLSRKKEQQNAKLTDLLQKEAGLRRSLEEIPELNEKQLNARIAELEQQKVERESANQKMEALSAKIKALEQEAARRQEELEELLRKQADAEAECDAQKKQYQEHETAISDLTRETEQIKKDCAGAETELAEKQKACEEIKRQLADISGSASEQQQQLNALQEEYDLLTGENGGIEAALTQKQRCVEEAKAKQDALKQSAKEAAEQLRTLTDENEKLESDRKILMQDKLPAAKQAKQQSEEAFAAAEKLLRELTGETESLTAAEAEMQEKVQNAQAANDAAR